MALPAVHQQEHSSNKFYPPQVGADATLFRNSLVTQILGESACNRKAIVIEAQAGQGKSTLALQFLQHFTLRFSWYQIGPEDRDPSLLLSSLLENFEQKLPGFTSPRLSRIMDQEEIDSLDIIHCANILLTDLDRYLADDFYIVFDDLHLGEQTPLFNGLLGHVVDSSPPHIHFILISRRPLLRRQTRPPSCARLPEDRFTAAYVPLSAGRHSPTLVNLPGQKNSSAREWKTPAGFLPPTCR